MVGIWCSNLCLTVQWKEYADCQQRDRHQAAPPRGHALVVELVEDRVEGLPAACGSATLEATQVRAIGNANKPERFVGFENMTFLRVRTGDE